MQVSASPVRTGEAVPFFSIQSDLLIIAGFGHDWVEFRPPILAKAIDGTKGLRQLSDSAKW
jgi:hypothetical protein